MGPNYVKLLNQVPYAKGNKATWTRLDAMKREEDKRYLAYLEEAQAMGFTERDAIDNWFSPEMI